ncbi:hypothetical protein BAC1_00008 [uncultured bacterium]|nr:hypothetical protein BAC1_00008 [uncultured bacterium]
MKKNLVTIFLLFGAVALNLGMLVQSSSAGNHDVLELNAAVIAAGLDATYAALTSGQELAATGESLPYAVSDRCASDGAVIHHDLGFKVAASGPVPHGRPLHLAAQSAPVFSSPPPVPRDRPPMFSV